MSHPSNRSLLLIVIHQLEIWPGWVYEGGGTLDGEAWP
jgi:hypothetical protein